MHIHETVDALLTSKRIVSELENENVLTLKAIGYQLASRYKFSQDKESSSAKNILATLISVRKLVKSKMGVTDALIERFERQLS